VDDRGTSSSYAGASRSRQHQHHRIGDSLLLFNNNGNGSGSAALEYRLSEDATAPADAANAMDPIGSSTRARIELECGGGLFACPVNQESWGADAADLSVEQVQLLASMTPIPEPPSLPCDTSSYILTVSDQTGARTRYQAPLSMNYCLDIGHPALDSVLVGRFESTLRW
jgi:hypothetical protein